MIRFHETSKWVFLALFWLLLIGAHTAKADQLKVVAFGASQTYGKGVARGRDYPAQMQRLLRANGIAATVLNAGRNGNTTEQMLYRLDASVPRGTDVVIFQPGSNYRRKGISRAQRKANVKAIKRRLKSRGIIVIMMRNRVFRKLRRSSAFRGADGQHFTAAGYHELARWFARKVLRRIGY